MKNSHGKSEGRCFLKPFFSHSRKRFSELPYKILSLLYMISLAYKISHSLIANNDPELRCVICTGITLFAPVLHFLHWCYTRTALLSANQNRVIFSCVLLSVKAYQNAQRNYLLWGEWIYDQSETTLRETEQTQVRVI